MDNGEFEMAYDIGDIGPAGYIFYDKKNNSVGWRYLEAAPADLREINGFPSVNAKALGYVYAPATIVFGYYRMTKQNTICCVAVPSASASQDVIHQPELHDIALFFFKKEDVLLQYTVITIS